VKFARRMDYLKASEIREVLKLAERSDIISFAGGLPAPELFPIEELAKVSQIVLKESGRQALQYGPTDGFEPLREKIAKRMNVFGFKTAAENILITNGSQQGLDFSARVFLNEGDIVICESPSYLGAINAFKACMPEFVEISTDSEGMVMEDLEEVLKTRTNVKMIYVIPDFQNPSGRTWSIERRKRLIKLANEYDLPVIEDNPYGELRFEGQIPPSLKAFDTEGRVIFLGTFSKTFSPGMRIGWVIADTTILQKYNCIKQGSDLQTSTIAQREMDKFLEMYDLDTHIEKIKEVYRNRRDVMIEAIKEHFPGNISYTYPEGGLFTWVVLPEHINTREVMIKALENKVAFVPGGSFFPNGGNENTFRLNYSNMPEDKIKDGIAILGRVLKEMI